MKGTDDTPEEEVVARAFSGKSVALGCLVVSGAFLALSIVLGAALVVTSVARNPEREEERPQIAAIISNRCSSPVRAGWVLSDTSAPFTSEDAALFFPPLRQRLADSDQPVTENQTRLIAPGSSAALGLGRPEALGRERILLIQAVGLDGESAAAPRYAQASVSAYSFRPDSVELTGGAIPLATTGESCRIEGLHSVALS